MIVRGTLENGFALRVKDGVWLKATVDPEAVTVMYEPRYITEGMDLIELDINGVEKHRAPIANGHYEPAWTKLAEIELFDLQASLGAPWELLGCGIAHHCLALMGCGWGKSIDEPIDWFNDIENLSFLVDGRYLVIKNHGSFDGFIGTTINITRPDPDLVSIKVSIPGVSSDFYLRGTNAVVDVLCALEPRR